MLPKPCKLDAELELVSGGVVLVPSCPAAEFNVEEEGVEPLVSLLDAPDSSVDLSVLKLAFDRRRRSFKNEGAIMCQTSVICKRPPFQAKEMGFLLFSVRTSRYKEGTVGASE